MPRVRCLFPILLLLLAPIGRAVNLPITEEVCSQPQPNSAGQTTLACTLTNTATGWIIITDVMFSQNATVPTVSGAESFTCPAALTVSQAFSGFQHGQKRCYVITTSPHASFTITWTISGGSSLIYNMAAKAVLAGPVTVDNGSIGGSANATSISTTTANPNEWVDVGCEAFSDDISVGSGFTQSYYGAQQNIGTQVERLYSEYQVVSPAGTITSSCSFNTIGSSLSSVVAIAFQFSAPLATTPVITQYCTGTGTGSTSGTCELNNVTPGKVVFGFITTGAAALPIAFTCTETCSCPSAAQTSVTYSGHIFVSGVCYSDVASSHSIFVINETDATDLLLFVNPVEAFGVKIGVDSGSAAAAAALTVNYSTASSDEWTFTVAGDVSGNVMAPGNSFTQLSNSVTTQAVAMQQFISMGLLQVGSGSHTTSYSETGSAAPIISTLSFGTISNARHSVIL